MSKTNLYISTQELVQRYNVEPRTLKNWRNPANEHPFPEPEIIGHGRSSHRYPRNSVAKWEEETGKRERLGLEPLLSA